MLPNTYPACLAGRVGEAHHGRVHYVTQHEPNLALGPADVPLGLCSEQGPAVVLDALAVHRRQHHRICSHPEVALVGIPGAPSQCIGDLLRRTDPVVQELLGLEMVSIKVGLRRHKNGDGPEVIVPVHHQRLAELGLVATLVGAKESLGVIQIPSVPSCPVHPHGRPGDVVVVGGGVVRVGRTAVEGEVGRVAVGHNGAGPTGCRHTRRLLQVVQVQPLVLPYGHAVQRQRPRHERVVQGGLGALEHGG
mmetsp:Transcript_6572/g.18917  ORF Transcript_6572/g.18917 Transcript_6572/m.18917 type:complete len:249 (+) Transcript_6572:847-1593(+)